MFWIVLVVLCLLAIGFAVWPLWNKTHRLTPLVASVIVFTVAVSAGLYDRIGSPGVPSGRSEGAAGMGHAGGDVPGMEEAIASLKERLANSPDDVEGWKMLGRTQSAMRDFGGAVDSLERAVELENGQNALVALLKATQQYVGQERRTYCDTLIEEVRNFLTS